MLKYRPIDWFLMRLAGGSLHAGRRRRSSRRVQMSTHNSGPALVQPLEDRLMLTAEIDVQGDGVSIPDGDTTPSTVDDTDFGTADIDGGTVTRVFTVLNTGDMALNLIGDVTITGADAADFNVLIQPANTVAGPGNTTFVIQFDPTATGTRTATVNLLNDDTDESMYDFAIQGEGTSSVNTLPTITSSATASVVEGTTTALTVTATDPEAPPQDLMFSLTSGADLAAFDIGTSSGVLQFAAPPDFEAPADFDGDNVYEVTVQVSDGTDSVTQMLTITVTNGLEDDITATLPDGGGAFTVSLVGGNVQIVRTSDMLTVLDMPLGDTAAIVINGTGAGEAVTVDASLVSYTGTLTFNAAGGSDLLDTSAVGFDVTFNAGTNADTFVGGSGNDVVLADSGDDSIEGGGGNDVINGGSGKDFLSGGAGNDNIRGEAGNDTINGGDDSDTLNGNGGRDTIRGGNGNDILLGGAARDDLDGEAGNDNVNGQGGAGDIVTGGEGDDVLRGGPLDFIEGTPSEGGGGGSGGTGPVTVVNIFLRRGGGTYTLQLNAGQVQLILDSDMSIISDETLGEATKILIQGDTNADDVTLDASLNTFTGAIEFRGSAGNDRLDASAVTHNLEFSGDGGADTFVGGSGTDIVNLGSGRDVATGGAGNDTINGGSGNDTLDGEDGDDSIRGEFGKDSIIGGIGNDHLNGNGGSDTIAGGDGDDTLLGGSQKDDLNGGLGTDLVRGNGGLDTVDGGGGAGDIVQQ